MARPAGTEKIGLKYLNESQLEKFFQAVDKSHDRQDLFSKGNALKTLPTGQHGPLRVLCPGWSCQTRFGIFNIGMGED
jgi:hypothetical protein